PEPVVPADRDQLTAGHHDQGLPVVVVDVDEPVQVPIGNPWVRREVAQVPGTHRKPGMQVDEVVGVLRPDRPDADGGPVREQDVDGVNHGDRAGRGPAAGKRPGGWRGPPGPPRRRYRRPAATASRWPSRRRSSPWVRPGWAGAGGPGSASCPGWASPGRRAPR